MKSDLEIAQSIEPKPITEIAESIGINEDELELFGKYIAKIDLGILDRIGNQKKGK